MDNNKEISIKTDYLLTLLYIFDDYESLTNDLLILLKNHCNPADYYEFLTFLKK